MSEKYIDLADTIIEEEDFDYGFMVKATLNALDKFAANYPDQVPGRTITHSRVGKAMSGRSGDYKAGVLAGLALADIEQVPDTEPTNAEKLERLLLDLEIIANPAMRERAARVLDSEGVKAPESDK